MAALIHASCVAMGGRGVLLVGPSGIGKSDVALRLIDQGAILVADDQTELFIENSTLYARAPTTLAGLIEARHLGLLRLPFTAQAPIALYVNLVQSNIEIERLPEPFYHSLLDCRVRGLTLPAQAASTPAKIRFVLQGCLEDV